MVAASRLARAQKAMKEAKACKFIFPSFSLIYFADRVYSFNFLYILLFITMYISDGVANDAVFAQSDASKSETKIQKILYITIASDRGLCGGIHSSVSKATRKDITEGEGLNKDVTIVCLGEKPKQQLVRGVVADKLALSFNQIGRNVPTFADALAIADRIEASGLAYDKVSLSFCSTPSRLSSLLISSFLPLPLFLFLLPHFPFPVVITYNRSN